MDRLDYILKSKPTKNDQEVFTEGIFSLIEYEDINYCEHEFKKGEEYLSDLEVLQLLNALHEENEKLHEENEQLKKELKRCKNWINSDENDYELTLAFIKNKGYSLKDVLEYEKELKE